MGSIQPAQSNVFPQYGRAGSAGDDTHLRPPYVHAVTMGSGFVACELKPDQFALGVGFSFGQRIAPNKVIFFCFEWHGEADSGFEGIGLITELVAGEDQAGLDTYHVERLQAERRQAVRLASFPHRIPHRGRIRGVTEDFKAQFPGIART